MSPLWHITGRLGNQMNQFAMIIKMMRERGEDAHFPHSPHYWESHAEEILAMYRGWLGVTGGDERVSIHVRRTDYLDEFRAQYPLSIDWYRAAMARFPEHRFAVFSDDIAWCVANFRGPQFDFSIGHDELDDLRAMSNCQHNIIANSTYSTWAALMNPNLNKIVVAPAKWERGNWNPVLPSNWILI